MIRICPKCGALLLDDTGSCSFCSADSCEIHGFTPPMAARARSSAAAAPARLDDDSLDPDWRSEVSRRLEQYRARRGYLRRDDAQSGLPFEEPHIREHVEDGAAARAAETEARPQPAAEAKSDARERLAKRPRQNERVEIRVQPELDFSASPDDRAHPLTALVPVASLVERRWAGALDAVFLGFTCAGFLGLFRSLGGEITVGKTDVLVYALAAYFLYGFYVSLFTVLAGSTPGMQLRGLVVVRLDGSLPDTRQFLWRSFGYLLSGATLMLGFVWSLWDEDHFTWQDRISQTYVTAAAPLSDFDSFGVRAPGGQRFAHK